MPTNRRQELQTMHVQGVKINLLLDEHVFAPSPNGSFYADSVRVAAGERVIDIGTGSGMLAIFAALKGGIVSATDIEAEAVALARRNFALNQVNVTVAQGHLFAGFSDIYDVILANLPNEIVPPAHRQAIGSHLADTFDGGDKGNQLILALLATAKQFMHPKSRLYLPVHTLTDYHDVLQKAIADYTITLVAAAQLPAKDFVRDHLDFYLKLNEQGTIRIFQQNHTWYTNGYVFEARLKKPA